MTIIGKDFPVRAHAFLLSSEKRASSAAIAAVDYQFCSGHEAGRVARKKSTPRASSMGWPIRPSGVAPHDRGACLFGLIDQHPWGRYYPRVNEFARTLSAAYATATCLVDDGPWILERSATGLREADLNVLSKLGNQGLEGRLEPEAFTGGEVGREDDLLDFLVGCPVYI